MSESTSFIWTPPPELVAQSNLTAFLLAVGEESYDSLAAKAEEDPAWLMQEVIKFCEIRFYRHQYRSQLHRQTSCNGGVGPDLSCLGRRR
jgi:hypothetical protein